MPRYSLHQFDVCSDLELPALECSVPDGGVRDGSEGRQLLRFCHTPGALREWEEVHLIGTRGGGFLRAYDVGDGILICSGALKMHIAQNGAVVRFDFDENKRDETQFALALGTNLVISLCTLLRGELPLHGAGVEVEGRFIGLLAPSGAGKSTLLWALLARGARFGTDDVIPLRATNESIHAFPSGAMHAKVSESQLEWRGLNSSEHEEWTPGSDEFWLPLAGAERVSDACPLQGLFVLRPLFDADSAGFGVHPVPTHLALPLLLENTQGLWAASGCIKNAPLLENYRQVARRVPIWVLEYPRRREALPALMDNIRDVLRFSARRD